MPDICVEQIMEQIKKDISSNGKKKSMKYESKRFVSIYHNSILERIEGKEELVLFGAGRYGKSILQELKKDHVQSVKCFCDNNQNFIGMKIMEEEVLAPMEAFKKFPNAMFIITVINFPVEITAQLLEMGVKVENIIFYNYAKSGL